MFLLLACAEPETPACTAAVDADVTLVIGVDCDLPEGAAAITFSAADGPRTTPTVKGPGPAHFDLVGLPADTDVDWTLTMDGADTTTGTTRTGPRPDDLPVVTPTVDAAGQSDDAYVFGSFYQLGADQALLAAYTRDGTLVWYQRGQPDHNALDWAWSQAGEGLLHFEFAADMVTDDSAILRTTLAGDVLDTVPTPQGHHMFEELPDGTLAWQALDIRPVTLDGDTQDWAGDAIVETTPDGTSTTVYSVWDTLTPTWNDYMSRPNFYPGLDWTHGNALSYDAATDHYLLSLGHAQDVLDIDRATATATAIYGRDGLPADPALDYQHDAHWLPDGHLLMFSTHDGVSGGVEYAVDDAGLTRVWHHDFDDNAIYLGEARRLANGNTFVSGGALGILREVRGEDEVLWELTVEGWGFAQWALVDDLYTGAAAD